jgi:hypothetical protein
MQSVRWSYISAVAAAAAAAAGASQNQPNIQQGSGKNNHATLSLTVRKKSSCSSAWAEARRSRPAQRSRRRKKSEQGPWDSKHRDLVAHRAEEELLQRLGGSEEEQTCAEKQENQKIRTRTMGQQESHPRRSPCGRRAPAALGRKRGADLRMQHLAHHAQQAKF